MGTVAKIHGVLRLWWCVYLLRLASLPGSKAERNLAAASNWVDLTTVVSLYPSTVGTDGNATIRARLEGPGCVADGNSLSLTFLGASPSGQDVAVSGQVAAGCDSATFLLAQSSAFRAIRPGAYNVRMLAGRNRLPLSFVCDSAADATGTDNSTSAANATHTSETTLVTIVEAPVGRFLGQSAAANSTDVTVTLSVGLDAPSPLPTTMGLRLSDPTAADASPLTVTWRPGEMGAKQFRLAIRRAARPNSTAALWAEALPVSNLVLAGAAAAKLAVQVPMPGFYVVPSQAVYRGSSGNSSAGNATRGNNTTTNSTGSSSSSGGGGSASSGSGNSSANVAVGGSGGTAAALLRTQGSAALESVAVAVRRAAPSPFASALNYTVTLLRAIGCPSVAPCASAVRGNGSLRFAPEDDIVFANVTLNWTAIPPDATLRVGLRLTPVENAEALALPANATALSVYGTTYGVCPAGTLGPWQEPAAAAAAAAVAAPPGGDPLLLVNGNASVASPPPALASAGPSGSNSTCSVASLLSRLSEYVPTAAFEPVLTACSSGAVRLVAAADANSTGGPSVAAAQPSVPSPSPSSPQPQQQGQGQAPSTQLELRVPYGQELVAVVLPLGSAVETVVVLQSNCTPAPAWQTILLPASAGNETDASASGAPASSAAAGMAAAFARWTLPAAVQPCAASVGVFSAVPQSVGQDGGGSGSPAPPAGGTPGATPAGRRLLDSGLGNEEKTGNGDVRRSLASSNTIGSPSSGSSAPPCPTPPSPAPAPAGTGTGLSVVSMVQLRSYNIALRPLSDPWVFSSLSLVLRNQTSGRLLPLCGAPQPLLQAAATQLYPNVSTPSAKQIGIAAATLAQAIRGDCAAVLQLQQAAAGGKPAGGRRRHKLLAVLRAPQRWLAALLTDWRSGVGFAVGGGRATRAVSQANAEVDGVLETAAAKDERGQGAIGSSSRRRLLEGSSAAASPAASPPSPASGEAPEPDGGAPPPDAEEPPRTPTAPPAELALESDQAAGPVPSAPAREDSSSNASPNPDAAPPANDGAAPAAAPDGFDMPDGSGSTVHVLFNQQYLDGCNLGEAQAVDLSLLGSVSGSGDDMVLQASSGGLPLQTADGGVVRVGAELRAALLQEREAAAAAAAALAAAAAASPPPKLDISGAGGSTAVLMSTNSNGIGPAGGANPPAPAPTPSDAGNIPTAPGASNSDSGDGGAGCLLDDSSRLTPDRRLSVSLLAPDGASSAAVLLDVYLDYGLAVAGAIAQAEQCMSGGDGTAEGAGAGVNATAGGGGYSSSAQQPPAGALAAAPPPPASLQAVPQLQLLLPEGLPGVASPLSLFDACDACGPGSYAALRNASACAACPPGSFSGELYNAACAPCPAGSFAVQWGSAACRLCPAGSFAPRNASSSCSLCPEGTTTLTDGEAACVEAPPAGGGEGGYALLVSFQVLLSVSDGGGGGAVSPLAANTTGIDAPTDSIVRLLVAADTADALHIAPTQVRVSLMEVSPSAFLVNVSATVPLGQSASGAGGAASAPGGEASPSKEVDADTLINKLVSDPDSSFPRTIGATGGSLQVQNVERQVVTLDGRSRGLNPHVVVWPTLAGTAVLAVVVGFACSRYCRRRRGRVAGGGLPPLSDAFGRLFGGGPSAPPVYFLYGQMPSLELQDMPPPPPPTAPRHRRVGSKSGPAGGGALGMGMVPGAASQGMMAGGASASASDLDVLAAMYTREALSGPRI